MKIGQATVKVFPQHLVNGKPEKIEGAKAAELKIQVTKLDAPKKVKATVHGNYINLDYDSPAYGYGRETYRTRTMKSIVEKKKNTQRRYLA